MRFVQALFHDGQLNFLLALPLLDLLKAFIVEHVDNLGCGVNREVVLCGMCCIFDAQI